MDTETLANQIREICKTCSIELRKTANTPANLGKTPAYVIAEMLLATLPKNTIS